MEFNKLIYFFLIVLIFILTSGLNDQYLTARDPDDTIVIVVNKGTPDLSKSYIRKIFLGRTNRFPNGVKVKILINKNMSIYNAFCSKYMQMSTRSLENLWVKKNIRDGVSMPRKVSTNVILTMVKHSNKFIGFVRKSEVSDVKIIY